VFQFEGYLKAGVPKRFAQGNKIVRVVPLILDSNAYQGI